MDELACYNAKTYDEKIKAEIEEISLHLARMKKVPGPETPHHYIFANIALRKACEEDPLAFFDVIASPQRDEFLKDVWQQIRENYDTAGIPPFELSDIRFTTCRLKNSPCIVVSMPRPAQIAEAHFVAIVLNVNSKSKSPSEQPRILYFTLEKGVNVDGSERTVLGGWSDNDTHLNFGSGPPATLEDFVRTIEQMI